MPPFPISYSSVSCCRRCLRCAKRCSFCSAVSCWRLFSFVVHAEFKVGILQRIVISQTTDSHFANYRFSFRKLQIFTSQTTDFHFVSFHFVSFHFVSFHFVSFHFVSQTTVSLCQLEAQVLEPTSVTLFCLNCLLRQPLTYDTFWRTFYAVRTTRSRFRNDEV